MMKPQAKKQIEVDTFERSFVTVRDSVNEDDRTIELSFSSEEPYERWFGIEVLSHDPQSVKLDRLNNGAAVLVGHDHRDQVGVVLNARIDSDKRGRATVKFSRSVRGAEIFNDVIDGIRQLVSVGYQILKYEVTERKGEPDLIKVLEWMPIEISIVPIPADATVGVGRSKTTPTHEELPMDPVTEDDTTPTGTARVPVVVDEKGERQRIRTDETRRIDSIRALGGKYDGLDDLVRAAIDKGTDIGEFNATVAEELGRRNNELRKNETRAPDLDLDEREVDKFSMIRLMNAIANPKDSAAQSRAGYELEVCAAAADKLPSGFNVRGVFIPQIIAHRDLTVAADGDLVGTDHRGDRFIDVLRNNMTALQSGAIMLPGLIGNVDIPRQTSGASATWISAEDDDATESEPTFDTVTLTPKDLAVYTEVTRRLTQQSAPAVEGLIRRDLAMAIALGLDSAVFYGSGASGQPQGIDGATGVDDPTISSAAAPTYLELVTQMKTMMVANAANNLRYIGSPAFWESVMTTPKQGSGVEGNFILSDAMTILGRAFLVSTQLAADDFVLGDFSQVLIGEWGGYELNVDPYTHSLKGKTRYVVFKTCDIAIRQPTAFSFHNAA